MIGSFETMAAVDFLESFIPLYLLVMQIPNPTVETEEACCSTFSRQIVLRALFSSVLQCPLCSPGNSLIKEMLSWVGWERDETPGKRPQVIWDDRDNSPHQLELALTKACFCDCLQKDYHFEYTECDSTGSRWRVAIPNSAVDCSGLPDPVRGKECSML